MSSSAALQSRRETLFLYDIRMGNPNGDPDENRPRVLPDGTHFVTDVRLKRFVRDLLKLRGHEILVDTVEGKTTNLTGRVAAYLQQNNRAKAQGEELVRILLDTFIDARLFGSSFAFKKDDAGWEPKPEPKTLTGAVQLNMGEVLHKAQEVDIHGTSVFGSEESKAQGTFTTYFGLRYALIGFAGVANEHSAAKSRMTEADYEWLLYGLWNGVRAAGNTRTKVGQVPRLLLSIEYRPGEEHQFGCLLDYVKLHAANGLPETAWSSPRDYRVDLGLLAERVAGQQQRIERLRWAASPDLCFTEAPETVFSALAGRTAKVDLDTPPGPAAGGAS
jgi:CRISPR-associated protein Csh2